MKKARKIVSIIVTLCFLLTLVPVGAFAAPQESEKPFDDVQTTDWFYEPVQYVYDEGLMAGTGDHIFSPQQTTTRGMIVTILHRMAGSPDADVQDFIDVDADAWYAQAVDWAIENGVGSGYGGGLFGPDDAITREQMASFLHRYAEFKGYDVSAAGDLDDFADASAVSGWAKDVMNWAVGADLFAGRDNNQLAPQGLTTRAEAATILMRYCENIVGTSAEDPSDEPSDKPDTPDVDNPSVNPTPDEPDEPSTEPDDPVDDGEPGEISYTAPKTGNIDAGTLTYEGETYEAEYVNNQLVVVAKDDVTRAVVEELINTYDAEIVGEIETIGMYQIQFESKKTLDELNDIISALKANTNVEDAYLNTIIDTEGAVTPDYPSDNWDIPTGQVAWNELMPSGNNWGMEAINVSSAWQLLNEKYGDTNSYPAIHIGVIDGYIDNTHPDLSINKVYHYQSVINEFIHGEQTDATAAENAAKTKDYDEFKKYIHGTHVMGTIGATVDNGGVSGVYPHAELYGASVAETYKDNAVYSTEDMFSGATALANLIEKSDCQIINYSRAYAKEPSDAEAKSDGDKVSAVLKKYLDQGEDFLIVSAAGNEKNWDAGKTNFFNSITDPDVQDHIIVVGNVESVADGTVYVFPEQSRGTRVDVMAPGTSIYSTVSKNENSFSPDPASGDRDHYTANSYYSHLTGTSMAAPHVAGVTALVWAAAPDLKGEQVKNIILKSANLPVYTAPAITETITENMVNAAYAVAMALGEDYVVTGDCGTYLTWNLDTNGNLVIDGDHPGTMGWTAGDLAPWYRYRHMIKSITIGDGVTSICEEAFLECDACESVKLGNNVQTIGENAFVSMTSLKSIKIPKSVTQIGERAIGYHAEIIDGFTVYGYAGSAAENYVEAANKAAEEAGESARMIFEDISLSEVQFAGGDGSEENPYQVATAEQLNAVRAHLDAHFVQVADISLAEYENWEPIGTDDGLVPESNPNGFTGSYDGKEFTISNLTIDKDLPSGDEVRNYRFGLFGEGNGLLSNIKLSNIQIDIDLKNDIDAGGASIGGIIGYQKPKEQERDTIIQNCHVLSGDIKLHTGSYSYSYNAGGIVGYISLGSLENCTNKADISSDWTGELRQSETYYVGGIAGHCYGAYLCSNYGNINLDVRGPSLCGGISGNTMGDIEYCVNYGELNCYLSHTNLYSMAHATLGVGGIAGWSSSYPISHSINFGDISSKIDRYDSSVGGIVGSSGFYGDTRWEKISNCYNLAHSITATALLNKDDGSYGPIDNVARIDGEGDFDFEEVYSIDTLVNNQYVSEATTSTEKNGQTLSEEEMNQKIQYILEALNLDQAA